MQNIDSIAFSNVFFGFLYLYFSHLKTTQFRELERAMVPLFGEISRIFSILLENISSMHFFPPQPKSFLQSPVDSLKPIKGGHFLKYGFCKKYFDKNEPLTS